MLRIHYIYDYMKGQSKRMMTVNVHSSSFFFCCSNASCIFVGALVKFSINVKVRGEKKERNVEKP